MQNQNAILEVFEQSARLEQELPQFLADYPEPSVWRNVVEVGTREIAKNSDKLALSVAEQIFSESETIRTAN
jgi:hypothetical protein